MEQFNKSKGWYYQVLPGQHICSRWWWSEAQKLSIANCNVNFKFPTIWLLNKFSSITLLEKQMSRPCFGKLSSTDMFKKVNSNYITICWIIRLTWASNSRVTNKVELGWFYFGTMRTISWITCFGVQQWSFPTYLSIEFKLFSLVFFLTVRTNSRRYICFLFWPANQNSLSHLLIAYIHWGMCKQVSYFQHRHK